MTPEQIQAYWKEISAVCIGLGLGIGWLSKFVWDWRTMSRKDRAADTAQERQAAKRLVSLWQEFGEEQQKRGTLAHQKWEECEKRDTLNQVRIAQLETRLSILEPRISVLETENEELRKRLEGS